MVPDPELAPSRWYRLRLRCRDDAKGPVTAVCGFSGYVVSSMGQKVSKVSCACSIAILPLIHAYIHSSRGIVTWFITPYFCSMLCFIHVL